MPRRLARLAAPLALVLLASAGCQRSGPAAPAAAHADEMTTIAGTIDGLRRLPDEERARVTRDLALRIRGLPAGAPRLVLAQGLANLSTEGDFGRDTLQQVTTTLDTAVRDQGAAPEAVTQAYASLAQLARYEQMTVTVDTPGYRDAVAEVDRLARIRGTADFTLSDLTGRAWTRSALAGQVVLVNFWATWCPPCRKEMPDLDSLARDFKAQGLVVLAISNEPDATVRAYIEAHPVGYPILLDAGSRVTDALAIDSIPKTFLYDRSGQLVAQSIDMRTRTQFLAMLKMAGIG